MDEKAQKKFDDRMEELKDEYIKMKRQRDIKSGKMKYFKNVKIIPGVCDKVLFTRLWVFGKVYQWANKKI